jgi:hypothetical protein
MREIIQIPGFNGGGKGQKATILLPRDRLYHTFWIEVIGKTTRADVEAVIGDIELKSAGQTIRQHSAAELNYLNRVNGPCNADGTDNAANPYAFNGMLAMHFTQPWLATVQGEEFGALGTLGMADLALDVTFKDVAAAEGLKLRLWAAINYANRAPGRVNKVLRQSIPVTYAGVQDITTLRIGPPYYRLHFFHDATANLITKGEIIALGRSVFEYTKALAPAIVRVYDLGIENKVFTLPFTFTQQMSDTFPTVLGNGARLQDLIVRLTVAGGAGGSANLPVISEISERIL